MVGVNNRNLHTFQVDMHTTTRIVSLAREMGVMPENEAGVVMYTPNLEFAKVMANKYETFNVYVEKY